MNMEKKIEKIIKIITAVCLCGILIFLFFLTDTQHKILIITYQFMLIVVSGSGVSWLYKELSRLKEEKQENQKEFIQLFSKVVASYHQYKSIKRRFRAKALRTIENDGKNPEEVVLIIEYHKLMEELNCVQLEFESYKRFASKNNKLFDKVNVLYSTSENVDDRKKTIHDELENIEKYLNKVVKEYERVLEKYVEDPVYLSISFFPKANEFAGPGEESSKKRIKTKKSFKSIVEKLSQVFSESYQG